MKKQQKQTLDALAKALQSSISGTKPAIKLIARFVTALWPVRSSNLVNIANSIESKAEAESVYRQIQRFLKNENRVSIHYLKLLGLEGTLKLIVERTEWKFGARRD